MARRSEELFEREELAPIKGKSLASLAYSRARREELLALFNGEVPASIMRKTSIRSAETDVAFGSYTETQGQYVRDDMSDAEKGAFAISNAGVSQGALSLFPQNIGRTMLLLYSEPGDVVVDPFAGHNSRMELCVLEERHYIGYDISERFMTFNKQRAAFLRSQIPNVEIVLHQQDSRQLKRTRDGIGDFTITSPPYYDIEDYGDEPEQLGKCATYQDFLNDMKLVMQENFRTLRAGAFSVWFVNDFRRGGKFYSYHTDTIDLMRSVGFVYHDLCVVDLGASFREAFMNQIVETRILPKRHEFALVFKKQA